MPETSIQMAPDGGYGWVVCAVAFAISFISDGILFSYGILMPEIIQSFNCSASSAALIGGLQNGITYFLAMLIFAVANKIGCRYVVKLSLLIHYCMQAFFIYIGLLL